MKHIGYEVYQKFVTSSKIDALSRKKHLYLIILAGGEGTRLFPYSNPERPKQFCPISNTGQHIDTFLKRTVMNYLECGFSRERIIVVTANSYQTKMAKIQLSLPIGLVLDNIWEIPSSYGYAGTMVEATKKLASIDSEAIIVNTPSDHYLTTGHKFVDAVFSAVTNAENGRISTIGIKSNDIDTVMSCGNIIYDQHELKEGVTLSKDFIEKPNKIHAKQLIHDNASVCNTGICAWRAKELIKYAPKPSEQLTTEKLMRAFNGYLRIIVGEFVWRDCGTLRGLYSALPKTKLNHNVILGEGETNLDGNCHESFFYVEKRMVLNVGDAVNCAVIFTRIKNHPVLVISNLDESQKIKELAENYSQHENLLSDDFSLGARNNEVLYSNMYNAFSVDFVNVEGFKVYVTRRSDNGVLEARIFKEEK